jgi:LysM repeat protein
MKKSSPALARVVAFTALVAAFFVVVVVISTSLSDDGPTTGGGRTDTEQTTTRTPTGDVPATYTVQNGDTLTSIARETGVSVVRILDLNPGIDPQILISGQKLKLR